ncbi:unnamed protein product [Pleuronectes platessa]|uniref:Uncharacterized protein n=1 Tax=Pleuronectes platessa TaxID=8262 RepID=A0A9N7TG24_PLEPL|nr:unnamed protein product [Pleuronectes platessa]
MHLSATRHMDSCNKNAVYAKQRAVWRSHHGGRWPVKALPRGQMRSSFSGVEWSGVEWSAKSAHQPVD